MQPQMHWVCGRWDLSALPLLMTGQKVRDIGVGAGVGQWAQQEVNRVRGLEAAGGEVRVIAARPDGRLRQWRRRTTGRHHVRANVDTTRTSSQSHRPTPSPWDNGWYIGLGPAWLAAPCGEMAAGGGVSTVVSQ
jgi:hypothetical protein